MVRDLRCRRECSRSRDQQAQGLCGRNAVGAFKHNREASEAGQSARATGGGREAGEWAGSYWTHPKRDGRPWEVLSREQH